MQDSTVLWRSLDKILRVELNPTRDKCGIGKLNRLAKQGFPDLQNAGIDFTPKNSEIKLEDKLTLSKLGNVEMYHDRARNPAVNPHLVIIRWNTKDYLIDGNHRVNYWRDTSFGGTFSALIISLANAQGR